MLFLDGSAEVARSQLVPRAFSLAGDGDEARALA